MEWIGVAITVGIIGLIGGIIVLLVWMDHRNRQRLRLIERDEFLELTERGLSDHAQEKSRLVAEKARYQAIGAIGVATALGLPSAGLIVTMALARNMGQPGTAAALIVLWAISGVAVLVVGTVCVGALRTPTAIRPLSTPPPMEPARERRAGSVGIQDKL